MIAQAIQCVLERPADAGSALTHISTNESDLSGKAVMELAELLVCFAESPAVRLLRSQNAPFICDFLYRAFKQPRRISRSHSELLADLRAYQNELGVSHPDALPSASDVYLAVWSREDSRWLQRLLEAGCDEPVYRLTSDTEDVFAFLGRLLQPDLAIVGTASRMKLVIGALTDLVAGGAEDSRTRLRFLRAQQRRIQDEIARVEGERGVGRYRPAEIRERFQTAVAMLKQLQGDFRAVEESFREITAQVQQQLVEADKPRGGILEFALDAEDVLKQRDQGISFDEFVRLLLSPSEMERFESLIDEVRAIPELADQQDGVHVVRGMLDVLQQEAESVMRTNQRLSATLRRMLDVRAGTDRRRVGRLLREIRTLATSLASDPPDETVGLDLETELAIDSPMRRRFWAAPTGFETVDLVDFEADSAQRAAAVARLASLQRLDWQMMRHTIQMAMERRENATLGELLDEHPPRAGIIEVLGYLQIARDDGHTVDTDAAETVLIPPVHEGEPWVEVRLPLVRFAADVAEN